MSVVGDYEQLCEDRKNLKSLRDKLVKLKSLRDKAVGAREQVVERLKIDHGCKSVKEAEEKLQKLKKQRKKLTDELEPAVAAFRKKYDKLLEK